MGKGIERWEQIYQKGKQYQSKNDFEKAIRYYSLAISSNPNFADAYYGRALCYRYYDKTKALSDFKLAFKHNRKFKDRAKYYYGLINFYIEQNKLKEALKITEKFENSYSSGVPWEEIECLIRKSLILCLMKRYDEAMDVAYKIKKLIEMLSKEVSGAGMVDTDFFYCDYYLLIGSIYIAKGESYKAYAIFIDYLKKIGYKENLNKNLDKYYDFILIPIYMFLDKKEEALHRIKKALKCQKDKGYFYSWYAAYAKKYVNDKIALKILNKARKNGYINEGILKSDILQGYFLKDLMVSLC